MITDAMMDLEAEKRRLKALYPWAQPGKVSANAKKMLQKTFPGVKFSVTTPWHNELRVRWSLGPTSDQVNDVVLPFKSGTFDILTDLYEYDRSVEGQAWRDVLGRIQFLSVSREWNDNVEFLVRRIADDLQTLAPGWFAQLEETADTRSAADLAREIAGAVLERTSLPVWFDGSTPFRVERNDVPGGLMEDLWRVVIDEAAAPVSVNVPTCTTHTVTGCAVTVTENAEKNGIEVRFASKPASETLDALKATGFRWSRFQGLWYTRRSPEALAFAHSLLPAAKGEA